MEKQRTMKNNKVLSSHSDVTELKDGTKIRVIVENYENPLFPTGDPKIHAGCKVEYVNMRGTRWVGNYFETHYSDDEMKKEVEHIISQIQKDNDNYKSQFAPK